MALQSSGQITLKEIATEFEDTAPSTLKEFYSAASGVPDSGEITLKDFYGKSNAFSLPLSSGNISGADIRSLAVAAGWDESTLLVVTISADTTLYNSATVAGSFPSGVSIVNNGAITGRGGSARQNGGAALKITTTDSVSVTNNAGAFIAGGGGGGGGASGGGGAGQSSPNTAGAAGGSYTGTTTLYGGTVTCGDENSNTVHHPVGSCSATITGVRGAGGNQGAHAGSGNTSGGSCTASTTSSCHGYSVTLIGSGSPNQGGQGGSILSATQNVTISGGGWGAAGTGSGAGAGGAAISGTATLTNNGTIYGST